MQWQVLDRAFSGHATMVLIGDPKQAIYAFRGGDVVTYLAAAAHRHHPADARHQPAQRRGPGRRLQVVLRGAALGDERIVVRDVHRRTTPGSRLAGRRARRRSGCGTVAPRRLPAGPRRCVRVGDGPRAHRRRLRRATSRGCSPPARPGTASRSGRATSPSSSCRSNDLRAGAARARRARRPRGRRPAAAACFATAGRRRVAGAARGARAAAPVRPGPRPPPSRRSSAAPPASLDAGGDELTDRVGRHRCAAGPRCCAARGVAARVRGRRGARADRPGARPGRRRAAAHRPAPRRPDAARRSPPRAARSRRPARVAARADGRRQGRGRRASGPAGSTATPRPCS